jgi:ribonuclease HI
MTEDPANPSKWIAFTDGASSGNPGPSGWGVILATPEGDILELGEGFPKATNNQMELLGTIAALRKIPQAEGVLLYTDSTYVIKGISQWIWGWMKNGWKTAEGKDVSNKELWQDLLREQQRLGKGVVKYNYVRGHAGIPGNERADQIAVAFSKNQPISLFKGMLKDYSHDLTITEKSGENAEVPAGSKLKTAPSSKKGTSGPSHYLSLLGSTPERHTTWAECERRVKGQSGARFKKVSSFEEERTVLSSWGVDPSKLAKS